MRSSGATAALACVLAAACAPSAPRSAAPRVETVLQLEGNLRRFGGSFLREREGIREARFAGPPYLRGYARGRLAYPQIAAGEEDLDALLKEMIPSGFRRWSLRRLLGLSMRRSEKWIGEDHIEEIRGIADAEFPDPLPGGWSPFARQLSLHALHDFSQRFIDTVPLSGACTGFAAAGPATADGHVYLARNFDFEAGGRFDREKIVAAVVPESGFQYLSVTFGGMTGVVSGFNEKGVGVSLQSLSGGPTASAGEPSSLLVADVLQNDATLEQAIRRIRAARVLVSDLYLVADATGAMAVVEKTPNGTGVRHGGPTLAATNLPAVAEISREVGATPGSSSSAARQERIDGLVARARGSIDPPAAVAILRDRLGIGDAPLGPGNRNAIDALIACHSVVFDLTARRAWVAAAPHTLGRFALFDLALLATAEPDDPRFAELASGAIRADPFLGDGYPAYLEARRANLRARRELAAGDPGSAERDAAAALDLAPGFVEALACRGEARLRLGDFPAAADDFDAAARRRPGPPDFAAEIDRFRRAAADRSVPARPLAFPASLADTIESRE